MRYLFFAFPFLVILGLVWTWGVRLGTQLEQEAKAKRERAWQERKFRGSR